MMREKNKEEKLYVTLFYALLCLSICIMPIYSAHAENAEMGGAVQTKGEIIFFEEETTLSISDTSNSEPISKPKSRGKLPSTGELIKKSLSFTGLALIISIVVFYLKKQVANKGKGTKQ